MEITKEVLIEALKSNPELASGILPTIQETDVFKTMFNNKVELSYKEKVDEEVSTALKKAHSLYDVQLEKAGFIPIVKSDGNKEKSYEMLDRFAGTYNELKEKESTLNADERIAQLKAENEALKKDGGNTHYKGLYETATAQAIAKEQELNGKIEEMQKESSSFKKGIEITKAFSELKIDPNIPESIVKMTLNSLEKQLLNTSKLEEGNLVYLDENGKVIPNPTTYKPKTTAEMLMSMEAIKDITLKQDASQGGGADIVISGAVETTSVEGKDTKRLNLDSTQITSQAQFIEVAETKMLESGITVNDEEWSSLKDKAFIEYKVSELPANN